MKDNGILTKISRDLREELERMKSENDMSLKEASKHIAQIIKFNRGKYKIKKEITF
jgi:hypothetical protein